MRYMLILNIVTAVAVGAQPILPVPDVPAGNHKGNIDFEARAEPPRDHSGRPMIGWDAVGSERTRIQNEFKRERNEQDRVRAERQRQKDHDERHYAFDIEMHRHLEKPMPKDMKKAIKEIGQMYYPKKKLDPAADLLAAQEIEETHEERKKQQGLQKRGEEEDKKKEEERKQEEKKITEEYEKKKEEEGEAAAKQDAVEKIKLWWEKEEEEIKKLKDLPEVGSKTKDEQKKQDEGEAEDKPRPKSRKELLDAANELAVKSRQARDAYEAAMHRVRKLHEYIERENKQFNRYVEVETKTLDELRTTSEELAIQFAVAQSEAIKNKVLEDSAVPDKDGRHDFKEIEDAKDLLDQADHARKMIKEAMDKAEMLRDKAAEAEAAIKVDPKPAKEGQDKNSQQNPSKPLEVRWMEDHLPMLHWGGIQSDSFENLTPFELSDGGDEEEEKPKVYTLNEPLKSVDRGPIDVSGLH